MSDLAPLPGAPGAIRLGRLARLLDELAVEFPRFRIRPKRTSLLQRAIHVALVLVTFGGQRVYLTRYHTVLFGDLWVPDAWASMTDDEKYVLLRHERVHLRQRARMGDFAMAVVYLLPIFPLFLAYGRARIEWEAYVETLHATAEVHGVEAAERLREHIKQRFVGPEYGWMWPFPRSIDRWFDAAMLEVRSGARP